MNTVALRSKAASVFSFRLSYLTTSLKIKQSKNKESKVIKLTEGYSFASLRSNKLVEVKLLAIVEIIRLQNRSSFRLREESALIGLLHLQRAQFIGLRVLNVSLVHLALHYEHLPARLQEAWHHIELLVHFVFVLEHIQRSLLMRLGERVTYLVLRTLIRRANIGFICI